MDDHNIMLLLGRIDGKLDSALARLDNLDSTLEKHDERITALEGNWRWARGVWGALGAAATATATAIGLYFNMKGT